jgi:predicted nucleotidyltransferase
MTPRTLSRDDILAELRRLKPVLSRRYGVRRIGLFGSFAKGEARLGSDIDVVVELGEPDLFALVHIKEELESKFQCAVDVIPYTDLMNGFLKSRIQKEAIYV